MKAKYNNLLELTIVHDVDKIDENLKSSQELAQDICTMISDEATMCNAVCGYQILESTLDVK